MPTIDELNAKIAELEKEKRILELEMEIAELKRSIVGIPIQTPKTPGTLDRPNRLWDGTYILCGYPTIETIQAISTVGGKTVAVTESGAVKVVY